MVGLGAEAVVEGQQGMASEGHDEGFFGLAQDGRARLSGPVL